MASTFQIKRSSTTGNVPSSLQDGELAINQADGLLFWKDSSGTIQHSQLRELITIAGSNTTLNPAKSTTYVMGSIYGTTTSSLGTSRMYIPKKGTITKVVFFSTTLTGTTGSTSETCTFSIVINGTGSGAKSTTQFANVNWNGTRETSIINSSLNIQVDEDDYAEIKIVTPSAWVTLPTQIRSSFFLIIEPS